MQPSSLVGRVCPAHFHEMLFIKKFDRDDENNDENDDSFASSAVIKLKVTDYHAFDVAKLALRISSIEQMPQMKSLSFTDHYGHLETTPWVRILFAT